jgi:putative methyltransferase (TIGR04325 family)
MDAKGFLSQVRRLPAVRAWRRRRALDRFRSEAGFAMHYGLFPTFEAARRWLPPSRQFDDPSLAAEYVDVRTRRVFAYDYPVMFHLREIFDGGVSTVLDIGGSVGVHFYAYQPYLDYPTGLRWQVIEVPAMARLGKELAERSGASQLSFVDVLDVSNVRADVWLSAGALQYLEDGRPSTLLAATAHPPRHLLLNKVPVYSGADFVTTQNIGNGCFTPHHVWNRQAFIGQIEVAGYELVDAWETPERAFDLFDSPERSFRAHSGFYFRRA